LAEPGFFEAGAQLVARPVQDDVGVVAGNAQFAANLLDLKVKQFAHGEDAASIGG